MNRIYLINLSIFLVIKAVISSQAESETVESEKITSDVIDLSDGDFNSSIAKHDAILVEFYAPWCSVCQSFQNNYELAANKLKNNDISIPLAKYNCDTDEGKKLCRAVQIESFPTFKVYKGGEYMYDYKGNRETDAIVEYMKQILGTASIEYNSVKKLEEILNNAKQVIILGIFKNYSPNESLQKRFYRTADKLRDSVSFGHVFTDSVSDVYKLKLLKDLKEKSSNVILVRPPHLRNKFESDYVVYTTGEIMDFINNNFHGLVGHRTIANRLEFNRPTIVAFYDVNYTNYSKSTNYWRNRVLKVAKNYRDITFAISNSKDFSRELEDFGLQLPKKRDSPPLIGARDKHNKKFVMKNNFTVEEFAKFVENFKNGKLEPYVISQELPTDNDNANVKVAVAKNFNELVIESDKDILIEFYAPWCGHCKRLEPIYEKLGKKLKNEPGIQIVKIDASSNDVPALFHFKGYPTIYWYPKNKELKVYEGERELNELLKFVAKHSTEELVAYNRNGKKKKSSKEEL